MDRIFLLQTDNNFKNVNLSPDWRVNQAFSKPFKLAKWMGRLDKAKTTLHIKLYFEEGMNWLIYDYDEKSWIRWMEVLREGKKPVFFEFKETQGDRQVTFMQRVSIVDIDAGAN